MSSTPPKSGNAQASQLEFKASEVMSRDIGLVANGDREAFRRLYAQSSDKLFAICLGITRNHDAGQDILQETYLKIWDRAASYDRDRSRPLAWLAAIARNTAIDWYRGQTRHSHVGEDHLISHESEAELADQRIINMDRENQAWTALSELKPESEEELKSVFLVGLTYPQAAERFNLPVATLKSRVRRSVLKLRERMADD